VLPSNPEKVTILLNLLGKLDASILFAQVVLEFINGKNYSIKKLLGTGIDNWHLAKQCLEI